MRAPGGALSPPSVGTRTCQGLPPCRPSVLGPKACSGQSRRPSVRPDRLRGARHGRSSRHSAHGACVHPAWTPRGTVFGPGHAVRVTCTASSEPPVADPHGRWCPRESRSTCQRGHVVGTVTGLLVQRPASRLDMSVRSPACPRRRASPADGPAKHPPGSRRGGRTRQRQPELPAARRRPRSAWRSYILPRGLPQPLPGAISGASRRRT